MRLDALLLCFLTLNSFKWCTNGINPYILKEIIRGVKISDDEGSSIDIDDEHKQKNPECGYLPESPENQFASSRISNAKEANRHYPWVITVSRQNYYIPKYENPEQRDECAGSIITQTAALTASHCICGVLKRYIDSTSDVDKLYLECIGGDIVNFQVLPPNEVTDSNILYAGKGSKHRSQQDSVKILMAYVMGSETKSTEIIFTEDVGLVFTKDETGNGDSFYQHTAPKGNVNVGSVCLAAEKKSKPYINQGVITTVGWGTRYRELKDPDGTWVQTYHSCATNEFGPISARLRQCDLEDILKDINGKEKNPKDYGCNRSDRPAGYDQSKCAKYLKQAERAVVRKSNKLDAPNILMTLWSLTNKIVVSKKKQNEMKQHICYKEKLFDENGWCYVYNGDKIGDRENTWGFCDSSCKLMQVTDTEPKIYHKKVWEFPFKQTSRCGQTAADYYLCISSILPKTSVFMFERGGWDKLKFLDADREAIEDSFDATNKYTEEDLGFQLPCEGDSGSGHWMYNSIQDKRVLVAITSHSTHKYCGSPTRVLLTTYPSVIQWIKRYSGIKK